MTLKNIFSTLSLILLSMFAMPGTVCPQTPSNTRTIGTVQGVTRDFGGALVPKAALIFESGEFTREAISDETGRFQIELPAGVYRVTVKKFGIFDLFQRKNVKVRNGKTKKLNVVLKYDLKKYPPVTLRRSSALGDEFNAASNKSWTGAAIAPFSSFLFRFDCVLSRCQVNSDVTLLRL